MEKFIGFHNQENEDNNVLQVNDIQNSSSFLTLDKEFIGVNIIKNEDNNTVEVIDIQNISSFLAVNETQNDEIDLFDMTSLSSLLLLGHTSKSGDSSEVHDFQENFKLQRLSLAYERLHLMPKVLIQELGDEVQILDISHNEFDNLEFLSEFTNLTTLICDHNNITENTNIPFMPKLELLWMNHCKISSLYPWVKKLQFACPNLKYLSLMGNPIAPSYLNGGNIYEYLQYRLFIISLFTNLTHLDDKMVTSDQRKESERMYHRPLVERLVRRTQSSLPNYFKQISGTISNALTSTPSFAAPEKNVII